jgi:hypothetical protein
MYAMLDPALHEAWPLERFADLHAAFAEMARVTSTSAITGRGPAGGAPARAALGRVPGPGADADPHRRPLCRARPLGGAGPHARSPGRPDEPLAGPVPGLAVPVELAVASARFGDFDLARELTWVHGADGWLLRWSPEVLFPELGADGTCASTATSARVAASSAAATSSGHRPARTASGSIPRRRWPARSSAT